MVGGGGAGYSLPGEGPAGLPDLGLRFPTELHKAIRMTNLVERMFLEVRRRTRPMGVSANLESAERIMMGIGQQLNEAWKPAPHPIRNSAESLA